MKRRSIIILLLLTCTVLSAQERQVIDMNFDWEFSRDSLFTDSKQIDIPHDFQIEQPWVVPPVIKNTGNGIVNSRHAARGFKAMGIGWYRKRLPERKIYRKDRLWLCRV